MDYIKIYADFLKKKLSPQKKLKVVFDCSNGTTGLILKQLITNNKQLITHFINDKIDGNFPAHGPNPSEIGALEQLQTAVLKEKADLGAIFDADGDRVFFIDNLGIFIDADVIGRLLIWHLNPKKIVIDTRAGWLIKKLTANNLQLTISRAGHYFIKKLMRKIKADFGAEKSGHYYFAIKEADKEKLYIDSGILAAVEAINAISKLPYSLADFNDLLPQYYRSGEINININSVNIQTQPDNINEILKKIEENFKNQFTDQLKISYIDGLTIESAPPTGGWWFNLRPSNTEPVLRLNIEAENQEILDDLIKKLILYLNNNTKNTLHS